MLELQGWLVSSGAGISLEVLVGAPLLLDMVLCGFCDHVYNSGAPLYIYLMVITAVQRFKPSLKHRLPAAWNKASNWRIAEPICHRTPLPTAVYKALFVLAVLRGLPRFAGCVLISFLGPTRVTETLKCRRTHLLLPMDSLGAIAGRAYVHFVAPKSARRGGASHQHATILGTGEITFLTSVFGSLDSSASLYPLSAATFRKRWDGLLGLLGIEFGVYTPGSMRGGGAVAAYMADIPISTILWRMRIQNSKTLEHYLQEVTAASSLISLKPSARSYISTLSGLYEVILVSNPQHPSGEL